MKDAKLVALAEAQWIRSYVRLLSSSSSAGAMETLSAACQRTCRSHPSSTGQPCTQCLCRSDVQP